jgi:hypothetical protein
MPLRLFQKLRQLCAVDEHDAVLSCEVLSRLREVGGCHEDASIGTVMNENHTDELLKGWGSNTVAGSMSFTLHDDASPFGVAGHNVDAQVSCPADSLYTVVIQRSQQSTDSFFKLLRR